MGSFNVACGLSHITIHSGDPKMRSIKINTKLTDMQRQLLEDLRYHRGGPLLWKKAHDNTRTSLIIRRLVQKNPFSGQIEPTRLALRIMDSLPVWNYNNFRY